MDARHVLPAAAAVGIALGSIWAAVPTSLAAADGKPRPSADAKLQPPAAAVYYSGCNEVRALGKAPLYEGQPGYRIEMDGDGDGVTCEPHRGY